jgi:hypothetical protein
MSCACDFPRPSLRCVVQLIRAARSGEPQGETLEKACPVSSPAAWHQC